MDEERKETTALMVDLHLTTWSMSSSTDEAMELRELVGNPHCKFQPRQHPLDIVVAVGGSPCACPLLVVRRVAMTILSTIEG